MEGNKQKLKNNFSMSNLKFKTELQKLKESNSEQRFVKDINNIKQSLYSTAVKHDDNAYVKSNSQKQLIHKEYIQSIWNKYIKYYQNIQVKLKIYIFIINNRHNQI